MKYIVGAYGTNNVGDEAIFEGASKEYSDLVEIYINKSNRENSVWYADLLNNRIKFNKTADELIIGGGGLIYSKQALIDFNKLADKAIAEGLKVSIQRVGFEGFIKSHENLKYEYKSEYQEELINLLKKCSSITVRSSLSQEIVTNLGFDCIVKPDFAYNLKEFSTKKIDLNTKYDNLNIGFAPANLSPEAFAKVTNILKELLFNYNIFFLPHSKSYTSMNNNDIVTANKLWSAVDIYHSKREDNFFILPFTNNPYQILNYYYNMDVVIGIRYHSFIFSDIVKTPLIGYYTDLKSKTFFTDNSSMKGITFEYEFNNLMLETNNFLRNI